jgi:hypothetical protein
MTHSIPGMNTKQLAVRSAVTVVATGLTLLSSGTSQAGGRGLSGARMTGGHGGITNGAIHQGITSRGMNRGQGADNASGRNAMHNGATMGKQTQAAVQRNARDDHGRHRERGDDHGGKASTTMITRGEREPGDDHGRHRERGDDRGGNTSTTITRGERERGDDHGRHRERGDDHGGNASTTIARGERERGDDHGRHHERGDDRGGNASITPNREVEPGDDHGGRRHREPGDDHGRL